MYNYYSFAQNHLFKLLIFTKMKKVRLFLAAFAVVALAACSSTPSAEDQAKADEIMNQLEKSTTEAMADTTAAASTDSTATTEAAAE